MHQYDQCVMAIYENLEDARRGIGALDEAGIPRDQISFAARHVPEDVQHEPPLGAADKTEKEAAIGGGLGGLIGLVVGAPMLAIPGVGPLILAGPLLTAATGAVMGGLLGAMMGWGVHEDRVRHYERALQAGKLLVAVAGTPDQVADARRALAATPAAEVHLHATTADGRLPFDAPPT